jgi:transmembrane sensor
VARTQMDDKARTEATRWLILLQEQPEDRALDAAFRAWLAAGPDNAAAWAETRALGDLIAQSPPRHRDQWMQKPRYQPRAMIAAATALAIAAAIVIALMPNLLLRVTADHATGTAQLRAVTLPDGSVAQLAPDTAIDVDYTDDRRGIRLLAGASFFEVERDAARPFTVFAEGVETTVVGTAFDVRLADGGATVAVQRGAVRVQRAGLHEQLGPGDWIRATALDTARGKAPPDEAGAWVRGELVARDQPVAEVVEELRAYFRGAILVTDDALAAQRVTGLSDLGDPAQTLRAIAMTHGASVRQISPWLLVLSKN